MGNPNPEHSHHRRTRFDQLYQSIFLSLFFIWGAPISFRNGDGRRSTPQADHAGRRAGDARRSPEGGIGVVVVAGAVMRGEEGGQARGQAHDDGLALGLGARRDLLLRGIGRVEAGAAGAH